MRKVTMELVTVCLLLLLTACGQSETMDTDWTVQQMAEAISVSQVPPVEMTAILPQDDLYETYLTVNYALARDAVLDGAIFVAGGTSAQEIAVFRIAEGVSADDMAETLQQYLEDRAGAFTGYLPDEAALLENSQVAVRGSYVALLACADIPAAKAAFDACFTEEPPDETPPISQPLSQPGEPEEPKEPESSQNGLDEPQQINEEPLALEEPKRSPEVQTEDMPGAEQENAEELPPSQIEVPHKTQEEEAAAMKPENEGESFSAGQTVPWSYSRVRLLDAWAAGSWSDLAEEDQAILNACAQVIRSEIPEGLSDYAKELAIHDWMIGWGSYDSNRLNPVLGPQETPNNDNPYGFLVDGKGICFGYSSTFQLFMDLLGIECITVNGTSRNRTVDHAWNQVRLDGEWYCVDVTWDDPTTGTSVSEETAHRYFNVTSEHMRATNHQWDDSSVPEAAGRTYVWSSKKEDAAVEGYNFSLLTNIEIIGADLSNFDREQREVFYQQARYCQAMKEADVDTLREMIAEDTVFTHMSGKQQSREEYLADIENGSLRYFSIGMENPVVEVDGDLASVTFTSVLNANAYGARGTYRISGTHWYERQNGVWIAVNDPN